MTTQLPEVESPRDFALRLSAHSGVDDRTCDAPSMCGALATFDVAEAENVIAARDAAIRAAERAKLREALVLLLPKIDDALDKLAGAGSDVQRALEGRELTEADVPVPIRGYDGARARLEGDRVTVFWRFRRSKLRELADEGPTVWWCGIAAATLAAIENVELEAEACRG